jgi:hypothetical protein
MSTLPSVAILAHRGDLAAVALATALHHRGRCRLTFADEHRLVGARVVHRPSSGRVDGNAPAAVVAAAGDVVDLPGRIRITPETDVVLCRIATLPAAVHSDQGRQAYAEAETFALALSWLAGLGDAVVNRPSPLGLAGVEPDLVGLHRLAGAVGLAAPHLQLATNAARSRLDPGFGPLDWPATGLPRSYSAATHTTKGPPLPGPLAAGEPVRPAGAALVLGRDVLGAPPTLHDRLAALADAVGLGVCEVGLGETGSAAEPVVTGLWAVPRLTGAGQLAALAGYLERRGQDRRTQAAAA